MESKIVLSKAKDNDKLHIAMFPWLAFGHMIPFLELSKQIAAKGHKISFISTPRNIDRLPKIPPSLFPLITFVKLPLPRVENLPEYAEATTDLPLQDVWYLKKAYDGLHQSLHQFLQSSSPDWIIFDFVPYWLPDIAHKLNIPSAYFSIFNAASLVYIGSEEVEYRRELEDYIVAPKWVSFPSTVSYRLFEVLKIFQGITGDESNVSDVLRFKLSMKNCDLMAIRTCSEFEPDWIELNEQLQKKPVLPVGVLPREIEDKDDEEDETWRIIKKWLDKQEKGSVIYIAFGTESLPSQEQINEIAHGLEICGLPFFWVQRKNRGLNTDTEFLEFPDGFEERVKEQGVVWTSWAPQHKILDHDSVGGFLSHSGWGSAVEGMQSGKALVLLTFFADQGLNAKLFEEKKIGHLITRNEEDGSFTRNSVAESLRLVMIEEEGKIYRDKATEMKGVFGNRDRQRCYVDEFLGFLQTHHKRP